MMVRGTTDRNKHNDHERVETNHPISAMRFTVFTD